MKLLAFATLSLALLTAGCKPDAAVKRGAVVDQPTRKEPATATDKPTADQQPPQTKVQ